MIRHVCDSIASRYQQYLDQNQFEPLRHDARLAAAAIRKFNLMTARETGILLDVHVRSYVHMRLRPVSHSHISTTQHVNIVNDIQGFKCSLKSKFFTGTIMIFILKSAPRKKSAKQLYLLALMLFDMTVSTRMFHDSWKLVLIIDIGEQISPLSPDDCSSISVLSTICKIIERLIANQMGGHLQSKSFASLTILRALENNSHNNINHCLFLGNVGFYFVRSPTAVRLVKSYSSSRLKPDAYSKLAETIVTYTQLDFIYRNSIS
uniref:Uncharacterized protein n=1 Tax=Glossina pallidipes TaxID=7398 RepID=A0A1A9ZJN8_GLOPL